MTLHYYYYKPACFYVWCKDTEVKVSYTWMEKSYKGSCDIFGVTLAFAVCEVDKKINTNIKHCITVTQK